MPSFPLVTSAPRHASKTTRHDDAEIRVEIARVHYLPAKSAPESGLWTWGYEVKIINLGKTRITLRGRRWNIDYGGPAPLVVRCDYVDGDQHVIEPGKTFVYVSGVPLPAETGMMAGHFIVEPEGGDSFDARTPSFVLDQINPLAMTGQHPAGLRPKPKTDSELINAAVAAFQASYRAGTIARISTDDLQAAGLSARAKWDIESFFLREYFNDLKQNALQISHLGTETKYLSISLADIIYNDIFLTGSFENLHVNILNKYFATYAKNIVGKLRLDPKTQAEASARLAHVLNALDQGVDLDAVLPPLPVEGTTQAKDRLAEGPQLSPERVAAMVAAVVADSTLGRLQKRYDALLKVQFPANGLENLEQARAAAQLSTTFDNLQKRRAKLGLDPLPKNPKVVEARRLSSNFYRKERAKEPARAARSRHRTASPA